MITVTSSVQSQPDEPLKMPVTTERRSVRACPTTRAPRVSSMSFALSCALIRMNVHVIGQGSTGRFPAVPFLAA